VNPSGGLIACGHPVGATGLMQAVFAFWQIQGSIRSITAARTPAKEGQSRADHSHAGTGTYVTVSIMERGGDHGEEESGEAARGLFQIRGTDDRTTVFNVPMPADLKALKGMSPIVIKQPYTSNTCTPTAGFPLLRRTLEQEASRDEMPEVRLHMATPGWRARSAAGDRLVELPRREGSHLHHLLFRRRRVPEGDPLPPRARGVRRRRHALPFRLLGRSSRRRYGSA